MGSSRGNGRRGPVRGPGWRAGRRGSARRLSSSPSPLRRVAASSPGSGGRNASRDRGTPPRRGRRTRVPGRAHDRGPHVPRRGGGPACGPRHAVRARAPRGGGGARVVHDDVHVSSRNAPRSLTPR
jgi:hypothetical protein